MVDPTGRPYSFVEEDADLSRTLSQRLSCRARRCRGGLVTASKYFAPDVPLELRAGDFAVVEQVFYELESAEEISGDPVARPTRDIPAFCTWFEPAVSGLPADLARAVRRASITVDDEGRMIEDGYTG